jgi:hypothetical protein
VSLRMRLRLRRSNRVPSPEKVAGADYMPDHSAPGRIYECIETTLSAPTSWTIHCQRQAWRAEIVGLPEAVIKWPTKGLAERRPGDDAPCRSLLVGPRRDDIVG